MNHSHGEHALLRARPKGSLKFRDLNFKLSERPDPTDLPDKDAFHSPISFEP